MSEGVPNARRSQSATRGASTRREVDPGSRSDGRGIERALEQFREVVQRARVEDAHETRREPETRESARPSEPATE